jgi:hypothetical protein
MEERMGDPVWVVSYSTGEYSDRRDWPAAWYPTEAEALEHARQFNALVGEVEQIKPSRHAHCHLTDEEFRQTVWASYLATPAVCALRAAMGQAEAWPYSSSSDLPNPCSVSRVERGTLPLHGFTEHAA